MGQGIAQRSAALLVLAGLTLALAVGCSSQHAADTMATVNGKAISSADVERYYRNRLGESGQQPPKEQADALRLDILRQLIEDEIMQQRAAKLNLVATDEEVEAKITGVKAPFTQEEFDKRLKAKNLTLDDLRRDYRRALTSEKVLNKEIYSKINITDADINNYYNQHKSEFNVLEPTYHVAQIAVTTVPSTQSPNLQNNKATNDAEAKKKVQELHNRLESGEDFGMLAANFSEDANTASNGGDMGQLPESSLKSQPEAYAAISKLKAGQITEPIALAGVNGSKTVQAYVIFKLLDKQQAGQREISDPQVQQFIRQQLRDGRAQLLKNAYYEMLRDQAHVENYFAEQIYKSQGQ
jgi:peptidyl-prolyl cis-trans isomerase SurA